MFSAVRRIAALLLSIALASATLCGCISEARRHLDRARILFDKRDLKAAKLELQGAIQADPNMLDAHKLLARVDEYLGDQQEAASEYEIASQLDPADAKLRNKARFYKQQLEQQFEPTGEGDPQGRAAANGPTHISGLTTGRSSQTAPSHTS